MVANIHKSLSTFVIFGVLILLLQSHAHRHAYTDLFYRRVVAGTCDSCNNAKTLKQSTVVDFVLAVLSQCFIVL